MTPDQLFAISALEGEVARLEAREAELLERCGQLLERARVAEQKLKDAPSTTDQKIDYLVRKGYTMQTATAMLQAAGLDVDPVVPNHSFGRLRPVDEDSPTPGQIAMANCSHGEYTYTQYGTRVCRKCGR